MQFLENSRMSVLFYTHLNLHKASFNIDKNQFLSSSIDESISTAETDRWSGTLSCSTVRMLFLSLSFSLSIYSVQLGR